MFDCSEDVYYTLPKVTVHMKYQYSRTSHYGHLGNTASLKLR